MAIKIEVKTAKKVFEALELKGQSVYKILVKVNYQNPTHVAYLFTGLENNPSGTVYSNSWDSVRDMMDVYSIKIVRYMCSSETNKREIEEDR